MISGNTLSVKILIGFTYVNKLNLLDWNSSIKDMLHTWNDRLFTQIRKNQNCKKNYVFQIPVLLQGSPLVYPK